MIKAVKRLTTLTFCLSLLFFCVSLISCKDNSKLSKYYLDIIYDDGEIYGKSVYKFVNDQNSVLNSLKFNLYANAYKENATYSPVLLSDLSKAYPYGKSYGRIEIASVRVDGENAEYTVYGDDGQFLEIKTGEIFPNDKKQVEIEFKTVIPESLLRLGINEKCINLGDFFPTLCKIENGEFKEINYYGLGDPYYFDCSDYQVNVTVPSTFTVACSGFSTKTEISEMGTTYSYELTSGRDFSLVLSKNYNVVKEKVGDITVSYYYFDRDGQKVIELIKDCLTFYEDTFGKLPLKSLSVAETPFICGGMEYSGLCLINSNLDWEDFKSTVIHELAHQWWHGAVGCNEYSDAYLDEGLAEYSSYLYICSKDGEDSGKDIIESAKSAYKSFFDIKSLLSGDANTTMRRDLPTFKTQLEYVNIAYNKSLLMFYGYEEAIGRNKAIKKIKTLYKKYNGDEIDLGKLVSVLGLKEHFYSFAEGKVII